MKNSYYHKQIGSSKTRKIVRLAGLLCGVSGIILLLFFFFPLLSWQMYFGPVFASQPLTTPIPKYSMLTDTTIASLLKAGSASLARVDYTNAQNWYPTLREENTTSSVPSYSMSIPKLSITNAVVSTIDNDLKSHLVNYAGTAVPPNKGTAIVFGHSTLPQLYNPKDYKTIFANAHTLAVDDTITLTVVEKTYTYKIFAIHVVEADDTSVLAQDYSDSYLTIITCTPPGTVWKRLILKAKLEKI